MADAMDLCFIKGVDMELFSSNGIFDKNNHCLFC